MKSLYESHVGLVGKVMNMQLQRQNVVMSNIANLRTPGYRARTLAFEDQLQAALNLDAKGKLTRTHEKHIPAAFDPNGFNPDWDKVINPRIIHGEDRVDIDKEMASLAKTSLHYSTLSTVMKSHFEGIRNLISEGQK